MLNLQLRAAFVQLMPECLKQYCCCSKLTSAGSPTGDEVSRRRVPTLAVANGSTATRANGSRPSNPTNTFLLANDCPTVDEFNEDEDERPIPKYGSLSTPPKFETAKIKSASFCNFFHPKVDSGLSVRSIVYFFLVLPLLIISCHININAYAFIFKFFKSICPSVFFIIFLIDPFQSFCGTFRFVLRQLLEQSAESVI